MASPTADIGYLSDIKANWRPLLASVIGLGAGYSFSNSMANVMGPHLLAEFGWSRAQFASVNSLALLALVMFPIIGRLTDTIGVRRTALIGVVALPVIFTLMSMMGGDFRYYAFYFLILVIFGLTTTATVYTRAVVQFIEKARGLALAIVISGPALAGATLGPLLNMFVEENGWRAGYVALAIFSGLFGAIALLMLPQTPKKENVARRTQVQTAKKDYSEIFRKRAFWILIAALLLANLPQVIMLSQLNLVMQENGVATADASAMLSAMFLGMMLGRVVGGLSIDRYPPHIVASIAMAGPAIGLFLIASPLDAPAVLTFAVFALGLAFGAEGDIIAFLVARIFPIRIYSTVTGLKTSAMSVASSLGSIFLGASLALTGSYTLFLNITGLTVVMGSLLILLLKNDVKAPAPVAAEAADSLVST